MAFVGLWRCVAMNNENCYSMKISFKENIIMRFCQNVILALQGVFAIL